MCLLRSIRCVRRNADDDDNGSSDDDDNGGADDDHDNGGADDDHDNGGADDDHDNGGADDDDDYHDDAGNLPTAGRCNKGRLSERHYTVHSLCIQVLPGHRPDEYDSVWAG